VRTNEEEPVSSREVETVEILTLADFEELPEEDAYRVELVRGRLVREPRPGAPHGRLTVTLSVEIEIFAREHGLGLTFADAGFVLADDPPTVRGPDIAFLTEETVRREGSPTGFWRIAPDLAVEILSPSNRAADIQEKVLEYLAAGTRLVWIVDPKTRSVTVYRSPNEIRILREGDVLDGADILPGLALPVSRIFAT
jgi:Uma2 family endonuclease